MKKSHIVRGILILLLISICIPGFESSRNAGTPKSVKSVKSQSIDPEDMVQGQYYFFSDHGSGMQVAQFDRYENGTIYNTYAITPQQSLFSQNSSCTVYDAGDIRLAGILEIAHLLRCILAGVYVP